MREKASSRWGELLGPGNDSDEIRRLRSCINNLTSLQALLVIWAGTGVCSGPSTPRIVGSRMWVPISCPMSTSPRRAAVQALGKGQSLAASDHRSEIRSAAASQLSNAPEVRQ